MKILAIVPNEKHDFLAASIVEGLKKYDIELYFTDIGNGADEDKIITDIEFYNHAKDCDLVLAFFSKRRDPSPKYYLLENINIWNKVAYIDGSEYNYTAHKGETDILLHPLFEESARWYFKRECLQEHIDKGIIPLPFASVDSDFSNLSEVSKDIDVLCAFGHTNTGQRKEAVASCEDLKSEGYNIINQAVSNYSDCLNRSWITVDAFGGGECNARAFEVMANKSLLFMEKHNIVFPYLIDGEHYIIWEDSEDLKNKLRYYLNNKEKISTLIDSSYKNVLKNHTSAKRVEYMFKVIEGSDWRTALK